MIRYDSKQNPFWIPEEQRVGLRAGPSSNIFLLKFSLIFASENIAKQCAVRSWQMLFSNSALLPISWSTYSLKNRVSLSLLLFLLSNETILGVLTMQHKHHFHTGQKYGHSYNLQLLISQPHCLLYEKCIQSFLYLYSGAASESQRASLVTHTGPTERRRGA